MKVGFLLTVSEKPVPIKTEYRSLEIRHVIFASSIP
jgi:hypothetical protein